MPIIQRVAQAGWEPIPRASTSADSIWVEQWGRDPAQGLYLTVMNMNDTEQSQLLNISLQNAASCRVVSLLSGQTLGHAPSVPLKLAPQAVDALHIEPPPSR
jgi:hypothetical protein